MDNREYRASMCCKDWKNSNNSVYVIEKLDSELELEWVILAVMHMDMAVFSRDGRGAVTAG